MKWVYRCFGVIVAVNLLISLGKLALDGLGLPTPLAIVAHGSTFVVVMWLWPWNGEVRR